MGPICDRSKEHLGASDAAIVRMRRRLMNAAKELEKTSDPPSGVQSPTLYHKHGDQLLLEEKDLWTEHYAAKMRADYDALASIVKRPALK